MSGHLPHFHSKCHSEDTSHHFLLVAIITLVFFIVTGISYASYLFIDATKISNPAGLHMTKNFYLALSDLKGELYSSKDGSIKNWMVHKESNHGFEIKHPNDWEMQKNSNSFLLLKKYVSSDSRNSSLATTVEVGNISLNDGEGLQDAAIKKGISWNLSWKEELLAGRMGLRTGKVRTHDGLYRDIIFWPNEQETEIFYLEATYFTEKSLECESLFNKIISEFRFT